MKKTWILSLLVIWSPATQALVCTGPIGNGNTIEVHIEKYRAAEVKVIDPTGQVTLTENYRKLDSVWDGHMTGLLTAPGFSLKYNDMYGCIRNVLITTNVRAGLGLFQTVEIPLCKGETSWDEQCGLSKN